MKVLTLFKNHEPMQNSFSVFKYALDIIIKIEYLSYIFVNDNIFSEILGKLFGCRASLLH